MKWKAPSTVSSLLILVAVTLACLLPFIGKALHIDDPFFVWCAQHIQSNPFDFCGPDINWVGSVTPMAAVQQNPPLAAYYLALVGSLFGWSEIALHCGFLLPALAAVIGTYYLARNFCSHPLAAALTTVTAPVFLLSSTSVMCDTMMLALWVWSVFFWIEGLKKEHAAKLGIAAFLIAACSLTKYFGLTLIPLLLAYSWMERHRIGSWLAYFSIPLLAIAFDLWVTHRLYGRAILPSAVSYATNLRVGGDLPSKILAGLAFGGGCIVILLLAAPLLWGKKGLAIGVPAAALVGLLVVAMKKVGVFPIVDGGNVKWLFVVQFSLFVVAGVNLVILAAADLLEWKTPVSVLLFLWIAGTIIFACAVNWAVNGRTILPMLPAASLLLIRRLETRKSIRGQDSIRRLYGPLAASLAVALLVAVADYRLANSARIAASVIKRDLSATSSAIRFEGHWGFQYYMEKLGAKALDTMDLHLSSNEVIVVPLGNSYLFPLPEDRVAFWFERRFQTLKWLTTMSLPSGAGYYSDGWGPIPFVFGRVPAEEYLVFRVRGSISPPHATGDPGPHPAAVGECKSASLD
jgi:4-amino-4-deoxy-L-arabinose transferase-like glycosyltransferase